MLSNKNKIKKDNSNIRLSIGNKIKNIFLEIIRDKNLLIGVIILFIFYLFALLPRIIAPYDPIIINMKEVLKSPSINHFFGTDNYGRDIFSRIVYASRVDLLIAMGSVSLAAIFGVSIGLAAGYFGGIRDTIIMRFLDSLLAFPPIIFAILIISFIGSGSFTLVVSMGIIFMPYFARLTRASVLGIRNIDYVQASKVLGSNSFSIMFKSILPNVAGPILVEGSITLGITLLLEALLSFVGLGVQPPNPSWGTMLRESQSYTSATWFVIFPGVCIFLVVLAFYLLGEGMRNLIDPKMKLR